MTCNHPSCIPCQIEGIKPGAGTHTICQATERRIIAEHRDRQARDHQTQLAWIAAQLGKVKPRDSQSQAILGRILHELTTTQAA